MNIYHTFCSRIPESIEKFDPRNKALITFLNPYTYTLAVKNTAIFEKFDIIAPDGIFVVIVLNLLKATPFRIQRFSCDMTSIVPYIFKIAIENNLKIFFLGTDPITIKKTMEIFRINFPNLQISGYKNGFFESEWERQEVINTIAVLNPPIILIGMGAIIQENMALDLRQAGYNGAIYTCGGFLHQSKDDIYFYPKIIDYLNLRFFYRALKENGFLGRSIKTYPKFCFLIISQLLKTILK
ncbi:WecB/TagA/CpsF family glycosyltransferase [Mucilaginibacter sp. SP1R1]|uniref:WecB/TagA/CpsF family glycosyltransferase n=1 Tax=Mucilaginibacter sp. SP1R1 TaxID=2723091 RepID=UPI0016181BD5|nr:N-acetylglucosaminyldiphosphoundecaprenol N-acetyl-beta-D-mannosaminyltransferase [Mucilaginibacter sp. SP1R1]